MRFKLTILLFFFSMALMSQKKAFLSFNNTPLDIVIHKLEERFDVKFSYNSEIVTNQVISYNNKVLLEDMIDIIEKQTNLEFEKVTDRYFIIKKKSKSDLTTRIQDLEEVVISEYLTSGFTKKQDGSVRLSPGTLGILPGLTEPDVLESLQLLPGIQSPSETATGLYIRGGTPDQNLILWDGITMYNSGHFFDMISVFNPYITRDVKLYTHGTLAKYGNRISSVIDISSSDEIPEKTEGGGGFNLTHADLYIKVPLNKKIAVLASARRSFSDIFKTITFNNLSKKVFQNTKISDGIIKSDDEDITKIKDQFYFTDITFKAIVKPNKNNEITFSNIFTKNKLDSEFLIDIDEDVDVILSDRLDINNIGSSLIWKHKYDDNLSHVLKANYSNYDLDYYGIYDFEETFTDETLKQNNVNDAGLSLDYNWKLSNSKSLDFGYQLSSTRIRYELEFNFISDEDPDERDLYEDKSANNLHSIYTEYKYNKGNKLNITLGLRASYASALNKIYLEPRAHLKVRLAPHLYFKSSIEQQHQVVSQIIELETQDFGLENQIWITADNESIPILESFQITSGLSFNKNGWKIDIDSYLKNINGLTSLTKGFDNPDDQYFFTGKNNILGFDLLIKKKINDYRTWLSYTFLQNKFTFEGINDGLSFPGNYDITHQLTWSHTFSWKQFEFSLGWNIRTGTPYTKAIGLIVEDEETVKIKYDKINGSRLPGYNRLDFSSTYRFNFSKDERWKGKVGISIINITNNKNILGRTYIKVPVLENDHFEYELQEITRLSLSFTPNLVFRVEF